MTPTTRDTTLDPTISPWTDPTHRTAMTDQTADNSMYEAITKLGVTKATLRTREVSIQTRETIIDPDYPGYAGSKYKLEGMSTLPCDSDTVAQATTKQTHPSEGLGSEKPEGAAGQSTTATHTDMHAQSVDQTVQRLVAQLTRADNSPGGPYIVPTLGISVRPVPTLDSVETSSGTQVAAGEDSGKITSGSTYTYHRFPRKRAHIGFTENYRTSPEDKRWHLTDNGVLLSRGDDSKGDEVRYDVTTFTLTEHEKRTLEESLILLQVKDPFDGERQIFLSARSSSFLGDEYKDRYTNAVIAWDTQVTSINGPQAGDQYFGLSTSHCRDGKFPGETLEDAEGGMKCYRGPLEIWEATETNK
ncbi:hypothetical protein I316_06365 [Kwoniella heveanensis BCC8398]|uniref:Uncharacterized protein n=1 Tax=Kwoniella heveanensis BCC8398 TaxID=1296120 RepID=A0A1B9GLL9_9TREE|nr:hypothetical protein I316_06365 [Kwoniella heveanensis BCC8398]